MRLRHEGRAEPVRIVESYRKDDEVKQRIVADLGRREVPAAMLPKLRRVPEGQPESEEALRIPESLRLGPVLVVRALCEQLGLWELFDRLLDRAGERRWADRVFVLIASRIAHPSSEHGLAGWLETENYCDREGRRFEARWHQRGRVRVDDR